MYATLSAVSYRQIIPHRRVARKPLLALATMSSPDVQAYVEKHGLQKKVEDVLNLCVSSKAEEPMAFMVSGQPASGGVMRSATPVCAPLDPLPPPV